MADKRGVYGEHVENDLGYGGRIPKGKILRMGFDRLEFGIIAFVLNLVWS